MPSKYSKLAELDQAIKLKKVKEFLIKNFSESELQKCCKEVQLSTSGNKSQLAARLNKYIMSPKWKVCQILQAGSALLVSGYFTLNALKALWISFASGISKGVQRDAALDNGVFALTGFILTRLASKGTVKRNSTRTMKLKKAILTHSKKPTGLQALFSY